MTFHDVSDKEKKCNFSTYQAAKNAVAATTSIRNVLSAHVCQNPQSFLDISLLGDATVRKDPGQSVNWQSQQLSKQGNQT